MDKIINTVNLSRDIKGLNFEQFFRERYEYIRFKDILTGLEISYMVDRRLSKKAGPFKIANKYKINKNQELEIIRNNFWNIGEWMEGLDKKYIFEL